MAYNYYCVDCGNRFRRREISFDIADLLGIKVTGDSDSRGENSTGIVINKDENGDFKKFVKRRTTQISIEKLIDLAKKSKVELKHGVRSFMTVNLKEFLAIMGENIGKENQKGDVMSQLMRTYKYDQLKDALEEVFSSNENREVAEKLINNWKAALEARFQFSEDAEAAIFKDQREGRDSDPKVARLHELMRNNTSNYIAGFWIAPEFFEDGRDNSIYTVRYSHDESSAFMEDIHEPLTIRGYCPKCGQPVVEGAGKYPHELVGLLGVQSAGKTSMIMAIIRELQERFADLGISYPGSPLCDSRYDIMQMNKELYDKGWAVIKTNASSNEGTFNVTLKISDRDGQRTKLVTFVDIAGEQCYDLKYHQVNQQAFATYPLIGQCSLYILCTCVDKTGYGNADGKKTDIPEDAVLQIAKQIYGKLPKKAKVPPLCVLMTKADMSPEPVEQPSATNPFKKIEPNRDYTYKAQLDNLIRAYDMTDIKNVRDPLEWCAHTYQEMTNTTYLSMMSCSALSRSGERYEGDMQSIEQYTEDGRECGFKRMRIDVLCKWIMEVLGLKSLDNGYRFPYVPSYREYYLADRNVSSVDEYYQVDEVEMMNRLKAVLRVFMNNSPLDHVIFNEFRRDMKFWERSHEEALRKLVRDYNAGL